MRVNQTSNNQVQGAETKRTGKAGQSQDGKGTGKTGGSALASDPSAVKPDISARGKDIATASSVARAAPDTREDKIAELKKRIAEGSYKVDAGAVADRMVNEHLADLG